MPEIEQATAAPGEKRPVRMQKGIPTWTCPECGSIVADTILHREWHAEHG